MSKTTFLFMILFVSVLQADYNKAIELFKNNDFINARKEFEASIKNSDNKAESLYYLKLINNYESKSKENFDLYKQYIDMGGGASPFLQQMTPSIASLPESEYPDDDILEYFEDLIESGMSEFEPMLANTVKSHIARYYLNHYELDEYRNLNSQVGSITRWSVVGEFENISGSGFDRDFGVLDKAQNDSKFLNKLGTEVTWFERKHAENGRWIYLDYNFYGDNSLIYAQTFVKSESQRKVQLRVGTSGSLKAWVNDQLVIKEEEERNNDLDTYGSYVTLEKGWNRILLQVGSSEIDDNNFLARLTDDKGNFLNDFQHDYNYQAYTKKEGEAIDEIALYHEEYFRRKIKESNQLIYRIILAEIYLMNDKNDLARELLISAREEAPNSYVIDHLFIQLYSSTQDRTLLSMEIEELKKENPKDIVALEMLYNEAMEKEDYDEAWRLISEIQAVLPESAEANILSKKINYYSSKGEYKELIDVAEEGYKKYPRNFQFLSLKYTIAKEVEKNNKKALKILRNYVDETFNYDLILAVSDEYFAMSKVSKGLEYLNKLVENNPGAPGYHSKISKVYLGMRNYAEAEKYTKNCIEIAPYISVYHSQLGDIYYEQSKKEIAAKYYNDAIERNPLSFDTREKLRLAENRQPIWELFGEIDIDSVIESSKDISEINGENVLVLTENMNVVVYENGGYEQKFTYVAKALTKAGTDKLQTYGIPSYRNQDYTVERAEVIKANGNSLKAEQNRGQVVFTNLEPGDNIVLVYRLRNYQYATLIKHFWDNYYINGNYRIRDLEYNIAVEGDKKFNYLLKNSDLEPTITDKENYKLYQWKFSELEPVKWESYMPPLVDVGVVLHYSSIESWEEIVDWYSKLSYNKYKADYEVKQIAEDLFKGKEGLSDIDKINMIYDYVVGDIRYSSISFRQSGLVPQKASKVINTKIGDCKDVSTLFKALCNEVGINSNLVLVNTRSNGEEAMMLPSIDFNHCIANFELDDKKYFVELTSDILPFSSFSFDLKNSFILEISEENKKPDLLDPNTRKFNTTFRKSNVSLSKNKVIVNRENIKTGSSAARMRSSYRDLTEEERMKNMLEAINDEFPSIKLNSFEIDNLTNVKDTVNYNVEFESGDPYIELSSMSLIKIPWADALSSTDFVSQESRNYPVALWRYFDSDENKEEIKFQLDENISLVEVPQNVNIANDIFDYKIEYLKNENKLTCKREFYLKKDVVSPEEYKRFREDYENAVKADKSQIGVKVN